jgi:hypothetical protein
MLRCFLNPCGRAGARLAFLLALGFVVLPGQSARAATITIPCSGSGGGASGLIAAINAANSTPAADTITLAPGCVYALTGVDNTGANGPNGLPVVSTPITISATGATITRSSSVAFRIGEVSATGELALNHLTLTGGHAQDGSNGAVSGGSDGDCVPSDAADGGVGSSGGGIFNAGTLTVTNSSVTGNSAGSGGDGAASDDCIGSNGGSGGDAGDGGAGGIGGAIANAGTARGNNSTIPVSKTQLSLTTTARV